MPSASAVAPFPRPRVLYVLWPEPLIVPGRDVDPDRADRHGGRRVASPRTTREAYPRFSLEAAVARAPEVIILADHSTGTSTAGRAAPEKWKRLTSVPAIQAGRLHSADLSILAPLRSARAGRARDARARHPSRGVSVSAARRLALALGVLAAVLLGGRRGRAVRGQRAGSRRAAVARGAGRAGRRRIGRVDRRRCSCACRASWRRSLAGGALAVAGVAFQGAHAQPAGRARRCSACRAARPSAWCSAQILGLQLTFLAGARRGHVRVRRRAHGGGRGLPDRRGAGRAVDPDAAAGRRHRRHLLHLRDHRAHLGHGLQPAGRHHPLAARQPGADPGRLAGALRGAGRWADSGSSSATRAS